MIDIVDRLKFDAVRCEVRFSKGVAKNIDEGAEEITRLRTALKDIYHQANEASIRNIAWDALKTANRTQGDQT